MSVMKKCSKCNIEKPLVEFSKFKLSKDGLHYWCKGCFKKYRKDNVNKIKEYRIDTIEHYKQYQKQYNQQYNQQEGIGVYLVELFGVPLYVGEGLLRQRKNKHLNVKSNKEGSQVKAYCDKHNINRKYLSFNVLEYEDDTPRRKDLEYYYRLIIEPLLNPIIK